MTRRVVYSLGFLVAILCTMMTVHSISLPRWISFAAEDGRTSSLGLHKFCSSVRGTCDAFPQPTDCTGDRKNFCHMWRTVGFLISFTVVVELATLVGFGVIIAGGVQRRKVGWSIISLLVAVAGIIQCAGTAIVAYLFNNDDRFFEGWYLDSSWRLSIASCALLFVTAAGIVASAFCLPDEGGYELIADHQMEYEQDEQLRSRISAWNDGYRSGGYQNERE
ncbi:uncharacterized protein EI97DRAFT_380874 [Westerdykella ornata]|uniref:Uncharacterized protein n=1 Tax=Westerdykella ornata TaxID=318751 RepID=A0A6A6JDT5_WESOR|nr:uncharacterized protein EI97DRAFT_380874 [Westerdykella ornata]KAF2274721.1 hypothetical protein EI97DRAFT_380874 [Westerdykella ornata]